MHRVILAVLAVVASVHPAFAVEVPDASQIFGYGTDTDLTIRWLQDIFGPLFGSEQGKTALGEYAKIINAAVLVLGAAYVSYNIMIGTAETAHHGQVLGKAWSSLWSPIRTLGGAALLVPTASGYCLAQVLIAKVAIGAVSIANLTWEQVNHTIFQEGIPIVRASPPNALPVAAKTFYNLVCQEALNQYGIEARQDNPEFPPELVRTNTLWEKREALDRSGNNVVRLSGVSFDGAAGDLPPAICGRITFAPNQLNEMLDGRAFSSLSPAELNRLTSEAIAAQKTALLMVMDGFSYGEDYASGLRDLARRFVSAMRLAGQGNMDEAVEVWGADAEQEFHALTRSYQVYLGDQAQFLWARLRQGASGRPEDNPMYQDMVRGGWAYAGTWFNSLAKINAEYLGVVGALPTVTSPDLSAIDNQDVRQYLTPIMAAAEAWLNDVWRSYDQRVTSSMNVSGESPALAQQDPRVDENGCIQGTFFTMCPSKAPANKGNMSDELADFLDIDFKRIISTTLSPLDTASGQTDGVQDYSWIDPLGELYALGDGLVTTGVAAAAAAFAASMMPGVGGGALVGFLVSFFLLGVILAGIFLAYIMPLTPYFIWVLAVAAFIILVAQAIIAAPMWAFAHMKLDNDPSIASDRARQGYYIVLNIFLRPGLMIGGLIAGMAIFVGAAHFVQETLLYMLADADFHFAGWIAILLAASILMVVIAERCFSLIHILPDELPRWISAHGEKLGESEAGHRVGVLMMAGARSADQSVGVLARGYKRDGAGKPNAATLKEATEDMAGGNSNAVPQNTNPKGGGSKLEGNGKKL